VKHKIKRKANNLGNIMISIFLLKIWNQYNQNPTLILYLDVSPEIYYSRLQKGNRQGKEGVSLEYSI
jgi:thymidylate kinase